MEELKPIFKTEERRASDFIPEGVFSGELSDSQKAGIRHAINLGYELQKEAPTIADDFREGLVLDQIVQKYNLQSKLGGSFSTVRNAVWYALRGYDGEIRFEDIPAFTGLIQKEEYDAIAKQHRNKSSAEIGRKNRESGLRQVVEKKGIHAHTTEERKVVSKLGAIARGFRPYDQSELDLISELALLPEYQRLSRINAVKIAKELNNRLYKGEQVRTAKQVKKMRYVSKNTRP